MCGKKNRAKLKLVLFAEKWRGLTNIHVPKLFSPSPPPLPPSHNPVRPLLTFIMEENFGNETSGHHINIYIAWFIQWTCW